MLYTSQLLPMGLVIFSGITNLVIGIYIYFFSYSLFKKKYLSAKYLAYTCFFIFNWTAWIVIHNLYLIDLNNKFFLYIANVIIYLSFISIIQALVFFAILFASGIKDRYKYKFLYYPYILVFVIIVIPELGLLKLSSPNNLIQYNLFQNYIITTYTITYFILFIKILNNKYNVLENINLKINIALFSIFTTLAISLIFITNILLPFIFQDISLTYYGPVFSLFIALSILIGMLKYKLFYIKLPVASLLVTLIITIILLTMRFSIIDNHIQDQFQATMLFIIMFTSLYIFLTREIYVGFKKQLLLDSKKKELEIALDSKNSFLKNSSHQFRTPLTVILGYLGMIVNKENSKYDLNKVALDDLNKTYISAKNLNDIINDVLSANDVNTGKFGVSIKDDVNLSKLIKSIISDKQELLISKSTQVNFKIQGKRTNAFIDSSKVKEAIKNIFDNAIFYGKGKIDIILDYNSKDFFKISIQDNGIGVTHSDAKRIWKKFERGKKSPQINPNGSGLGLYLAKQIIIKHGGDISLHSDGLNKGSKFTISIPKNTIALFPINPFISKKSNFETDNL
jgi:signal transduction histidine kinase